MMKYAENKTNQDRYQFLVKYVEILEECEDKFR